MRPALFENILAQPGSLRQVARHQLGPGRDALLRCAGILQSARRIVLTGMGASLFSSIPLSYLLAERGVPAEVIDTSELLYFLAPTLDEHTVVVLVSRSGESVEITKLLPILKERGCRMVAVSNVPGSTLARSAEETLLLNSPPDELVAIQTYTGTLAALSLLAAACLEELEAAEPEVELTAGQMEHMLDDLASDEDPWSDFTSGSGPLYFLGRGASLASVNAGVLLMHEAAKLPAVGMSVPQFRHGPVEVAGKDFRAVVIGTQQPTQELDVALTHDLAGAGARLGWIGPETGSGVPLCRWPNGASRRFAQVLESIPLQLLAYRLAQARGIPMGQFRFAPMVTLSESGFIA